MKKKKLKLCINTTFCIFKLDLFVIIQIITMELIKNIEKRNGIDVGYNSSNIHPQDREGCVGKQGLDKNLTLEEILRISYKIEERPNIIIKAGKNAKWYLKRCPKELIDSEVSKQAWRETNRCVMYIIDWDE